MGYEEDAEGNEPDDFNPAIWAFGRMEAHKAGKRIEEDGEEK